jgi:hypothetical protein
MDGSRLIKVKNETYLAELSSQLFARRNAGIFKNAASEWISRSYCDIGLLGFESAGGAGAGVGNSLHSVRGRLLVMGGLLTDMEAAAVVTTWIVPGKGTAT